MIELCTLDQHGHYITRHLVNTWKRANKWARHQQFVTSGIYSIHARESNKCEYRFNGAYFQL